MSQIGTINSTKHPFSILADHFLSRTGRNTARYNIMKGKGGVSTLPCWTSQQRANKDRNRETNKPHKTHTQYKNEHNTGKA